MSMWIVAPNDVLVHYGIKGQRWGVRRFQNPDGTLTAAGRRRRDKEIKRDYKEFNRIHRDEAHKKSVKEYKKAENYARKHGLNTDDVLSNTLDVEVKQYLKESKKSGISDSTAKAVVEYTRRSERASEKEERYYKEAGKKTIDGLVEKYGEEPVYNWLAKHGKKR